jgi:DNA-binding NtrC family response regulator
MNILVLEDDEITRIGFVALLKTLTNGEAKIFEFSQAEICLKELPSLEIDLAFIDLDLEEELAGFEVLNKINKKIYSVILTGHEEDNYISQAYELGAKDFIVKPIEESTLEAILHRYEIEKQLVENEDQELAGVPREVVKKLQAYSFSKQPIFISGETGTGKSRLANNLHKFFEATSSKKIPFVTLNCSELNESLIESEIFGHVKGAFTGADSDKEGLLAKANGGVLFIDEIGSISEVVQKKLLTAIETKSFFQVGGTKEIKLDFILISATCENIDSKIEKGEFRNDLFQRIRGLEIETQAFRSLDIDQKNNCLNSILSKQNRKVIITSDARDIIFSMKWDGNIRELNRFVEKLVSSGTGIIDRQVVLDSFKTERVSHEVSVKDAREELFYSLINLVDENGLPSVVYDLEEFMINYFYEKNDQKTRETIRNLRISNNQFYKVIKK